ncbi:MAG: hypothetical protein GX678_05045 [Actinomycetales bacterium]|nr:hypothetical protein [Actinomycetales bacterium]
MLPGLMIAHPYVMWFSWVMFLSAVAVAFVAGRDLGQGQSSGPAWRAQALLVLPVVVLSGFVAALFGSGVVKSSRVISAELLHLDPVLLVGLLVALSAFAAGVYRQVPWAALLALALHAAAHVAVFANSSFHDELVILVVAGLSFVAGLTSRKPAVASNWPADQTAASAREVAQPDAGDRS